MVLRRIQIDINYVSGLIILKKENLFSTLSSRKVSVTYKYIGLFLAIVHRLTLMSHLWEITFGFTKSVKV